jgi:hypothetical protein
MYTLAVVVPAASVIPVVNVSEQNVSFTPFPPGKVKLPDAVGAAWSMSYAPVQPNVVRPSDR